MTPKSTSSGPDPGDPFTSIKTIPEMNARLQELAAGLLTGPLPTALGPTTIDLIILQDLPISRLLSQSDPLAALVTMCRLLCQKGDIPSLRLAFGLAHKIYGVCRARQECDGLYFLYKGVAEIGLGMLEIGIKNVTRGLNPRLLQVLAPVDLCLGYWALMSAAVWSRETPRAVQLAEKWRQAAVEGRRRRESCRAGLVLQILRLLLGDQTRIQADIQGLLAEAPPEWRSVAQFLGDWTEAQLRGAAVTETTPEEPHPLFLGLEWRTSQSAVTAKPCPRDFATLCRLRRAWCDPRYVESLTVDALVVQAELAAAWELPQFLHDIEARLSQQDCRGYLDFILRRLLGQTVVARLPGISAAQEARVISLPQAFIWLMDVRGYTKLAEHWSPEENFALLTPVFRIIHEELEEIGGQLLEFAGDCIIIAFNTPGVPPVSIQDILFRTARCLRRLHTLNTLSLPTGSPEVKVGIGIDRGTVALGYLGALGRGHHSILGRAVNRAARIESRTKTLDRTVLVSARCFDAAAPEVWRNPQMVNFSLRSAGRQKMRHVSEPMELLAASPLLEYWVDFVPMGFVATPETDVVYIDTGNASLPGIIDHHFQHGQARSACELLLQQEELLLEHVQGTPLSRLEFRLHQQPDLDCAATLYAAVELLKKKPRRRLLEKLAAYVSEIDQGKVPDPENLPDSLYGVLLAHQTLVTREQGRNLTDLLLLEAQLRVIDAALFRLEKNRGGRLSRIFQGRPEWFTAERDLLRQDTALYREDLTRRGQVYQARVKGRPEPVSGLWLDHPRSILFKQWVRNDPQAPGGQGYAFLVVDWSQPEKNRFVFSVDPESGTSLEGLGELLEAAEEKKRQILGQERPAEPRRHPTNNSDPWYFGWGHGFTIIDAPREGTVLTAGEVRGIHEAWRP